MRRELLLRRSYDYVAKRDVPLFAALHVNGARQSFMTVQRATGDPRNFLIVDDRPAILGHADHSPDQRDIEGLPFPGLTRKFRGRRQETVDSTDAPARGLVGRVGLDLHFVAAAQIDTAV